LNPEKALSKLHSYSEDLGLDLSKSEDRFKWFLASFLFAKRISADIAKSTYLKFNQENLTNPDAISEAGWDRLVQILDSGGYTRYDFSTASNLLGIVGDLKQKYGNLDGLYEEARDSKDLEKRLLKFKGVGPMGVNIFLRELRGTWEKANPEPSPKAVETAKKIGLDLDKVEKYESQLVRLEIEFCKKGRTSECPLEGDCPDAE
jgi:endonuclease III